jgi:copper(I)-binding protein
MISFYRFGGLLAALLLSVSAYADDIKVEGAWTRATLPGQDMAMVYMDITSKQAATIVGVSSSVAKTAEMHTMEHKGGMMKMYQVKSISLPANARLNMNMHGYHLVLNGLKGPLKAGATVPLTLNIETADKRSLKVDVQAEVRPLKSAAQKGSSAQPPADKHAAHSH